MARAAPLRRLAPRSMRASRGIDSRRRASRGAARSGIALASARRPLPPFDGAGHAAGLGELCETDRAGTRVLPHQTLQHEASSGSASVFALDLGLQAFDDGGIEDRRRRTSSGELSHSARGSCARPRRAVLDRGRSAPDRRRSASVRSGSAHTVRADGDDHSASSASMAARASRAVFRSHGRHRGEQLFALVKAQHRKRIGRLGDERAACCGPPQLAQQLDQTFRRRQALAELGAGGPKREPALHGFERRSSPSLPSIAPPRPARTAGSGSHCSSSRSSRGQSRRAGTTICRSRGAENDEQARWHDVTRARAAHRCCGARSVLRPKKTAASSGSSASSPRAARASRTDRSDPLQLEVSTPMPTFTRPRLRLLRPASAIRRGIDAGGADGR